MKLQRILEYIWLNVDCLGILNSEVTNIWEILQPGNLFYHLKNRIPGHNLNLRNIYSDFPLYQFAREHSGERNSTKSAAVPSAQLGYQDEYDTQTRFVLELQIHTYAV